MTSLEQQRQLKRELVQAGFQMCHESVAVLIFRHTKDPELLVRVGTTHVLIEADGAELQRTPLAEFDSEHVQQYIR